MSWVRRRKEGLPSAHKNVFACVVQFRGVKARQSNHRMVLLSQIHIISEKQLFTTPRHCCVCGVLWRLCADDHDEQSRVGLCQKFKFVEIWPELHWPLWPQLVIVEHCFHWKMDDKRITCFSGFPPLYINKLASSHPQQKRLLATIAL